MRRRRSPEIIAGQVSSTGTITAGDGFSVQKTGTGTYTITLRAGFRLTTSSASPFGGVAVAAPVSTAAETTLLINTWTIAGSLADAGFTFIAVGVQQ